MTSNYTDTCNLIIDQASGEPTTNCAETSVAYLW